MKEIVKPIIGNHVAAHDRFPHVPTQAAHLGYGGLGVLVDGPGDDGVLQGPHDLVEEREIFRLQGDERISQRRVADAEFVADGRKIEHAPGQEAPFPHLLPDVLIHHHPSRDGSCFFPGPRRCRLGLLTRMPLCLGKQSNGTAELPASAVCLVS